jgi:hypothetical protein
MADAFDWWLVRLFDWRDAVPAAVAPDSEWWVWKRQAEVLQAELGEVIDDEWAEFDQGEPDDE